LMLETEGEPPKIIVRGLRYRDQVVRLKEGWRISALEHGPLWQFEALATAPSIPI